MNRREVSAPSVRVAVIGGGDHVRHALADAVGRMPGWSIVAVADPDAEARRRVGEVMPQARLHTDHVALLSGAADLDLIVIATPPTVSAAIARAAWSADAAILLEKPGAVFASDLVDVRADRSPPVSCAYGYRFHPTVIAFHAALSDIGPLEQLTLGFIAPMSATGTWRAGRATGGGALRDLGSHLLDLALTLTGAPLTLEACSIRSIRSADDDVTLAYRAGPARVHVRCAYHGTPEFSLKATGGRGTLRADLWSMTTPSQGGWSALTSRVRTKLSGPMRPAEALRRSRIGMLSAALTPAPANPPASVQDAMNVLGLIEAAEASAR